MTGSERAHLSRKAAVFFSAGVNSELYKEFPRRPPDLDNRVSGSYRFGAHMH
jgi:hypothetical protein